MSSVRPPTGRIRGGSLRLLRLLRPFGVAAPPAPILGDATLLVVAPPVAPVVSLPKSLPEFDIFAEFGSLSDVLDSRFYDDFDAGDMWQPNGLENVAHL